MVSSKLEGTGVDLFSEMYWEKLRKTARSEAVERQLLWSEMSFYLAQNVTILVLISELQEEDFVTDEYRVRVQALRVEYQCNCDRVKFLKKQLND